MVKIKLSQVISAGFVIITLLVSLFSFLMLRENKKLNELNKQMYRHPFSVSTSVLKANNDILSMHRYMKDVVLATDKEELEVAVALVDHYEHNAYKNFELIKERFLGNKEEINVAYKSFADWKVIRNEVIYLKRNKKHLLAANITKKKGVDHVKSLTQKMNLLTASAINKALYFKENSQRSYEKSKSYLYTLLVLIIFSSGFTSFFVIYRVKRTEEFRNESESRLKNALWGTGAGTYEWHVQTGELRVNEQWVEMIGYSLQELEPITLDTWDKLIHPDDGKRAEELINRCLSQEVDHYECDARLRHKQGHWVWILDRGRVSEWSDDGKAVRMSGTHTDITKRKLTEIALAESAEKLRVSTQHLKLYSEQAPLATIEWEVGFEVLNWNKEAENIFGYTLDEVKGRYFVDFMLPDSAIVDVKQVWKDLISESGTGTSSINENLTKDGRIILCEWHNTVIKDEAGKVIGAASIILDITERAITEEKLKLAASVFTHARESIAITDAAGNIVDVNDTFTTSTGYSREEVIGQNPRILKSGRQPPEFYADMWKTLVEEGCWYGEVWNRSKSGEVYAEMKTISAIRDTNDIITHYVGLGINITQMKNHQDQLERIAHYDILTNLPNRPLLSDRLSQAMSQCHRRKQSLAVAFLDLDHFKEINDTYGHDMGDELLIALSARMKEALREGDSLARFGGDEFVAVLEGLVKVEDCEPVLERLLLAVSEPITVGDTILNVSASIGVTLYPQDSVDADQLMRHADQAMYTAKQAGKNRYHLFDTYQDAAVQVQRENLEAIREALDEHQFVLHYQPKVNMRTGVVVGVEALIRWQHPERGLLNPIDFLPVIEHNPMMIEMGEWVIDTALTQISQWQETGLNLPLSTSVNIAAVQLQQHDFTDRLTTLLAAHPNVEPRYLELEVLETSALGDVDHVSAIMKSCMALGVNFALDDFGTGYSSLTYLRRLPASQIKIDQTFVRDMLDDEDDYAIVEGVIALAKSFKRDVIAEGVETIEHGTALLQLGCDLAQGYGIARPMPAGDIPEWIASWKPDDTWPNQKQ